MNKLLIGPILLVLATLGCATSRRVDYFPFRFTIMYDYVLRDKFEIDRPMLRSYTNETEFYEKFSPVPLNGVMPPKPNFTEEIAYAILVPGGGSYGPITLDSMVKDEGIVEVFAHAWPVSGGDKRITQQSLVWRMPKWNTDVVSLKLNLNGVYKVWQDR